MRCLITLFLLTVIMSCGQQSASDSGTSADPETPPTPSTAELRREYTQFLSAREHLPAQQIQEVDKLYPVDEALQDTAFFVWRESLLAAVRKKDIFTLMDRMTADIKVGFGTENGTAAFIEQWNLESEEKTAQSAVWLHLERVLLQGGAFAANGSRFEAPYVAAIWPPDQDPSQRALIDGAGVRIRERPSLNSGIATVASNDFVNYIEQTDEQTTIGDETYSWHEIETDNGVKGYVWGKFVASPIDYRAVFKRNDKGQWRMTSFLAGD